MIGILSLKNRNYTFIRQIDSDKGLIGSKELESIKIIFLIYKSVHQLFPKFSLSRKPTSTASS